MGDLKAGFNEAPILEFCGGFRVGFGNGRRSWQLAACS
jgi:hypothetical protein